MDSLSNEIFGSSWEGIILFIGPPTLGKKGSYDFTTANMSVRQ